MPIPNQSHSHIVLNGPLRILRDRRDHPLRHRRARHYLQHLALGQKRIGQRELHRLRMALGENRARHARRAAPRQRELLADGNLRHTLDHHFFGNAFYFRRRGKRERHFDQIEKIKLPQECKRSASLASSDA